MDPMLFVLVIITLSWGGPIGLGILMMGLGVLYWGQAQKAKTEQKQRHSPAGRSPLGSVIEASSW